MYTIDFETCGFHGFPVLLQYAKDDGPVQLHEIWENPIRDTLELFEEIANGDVQGFNVAFDWFHLVKCYCTFSLFGDLDAIPANHIDEIGVVEEKARFVEYTIRPRRVRDIMLVARRGQWQSLMERDPIRIRRVPIQLAEPLAKHLENTIKFDDIYFSRGKSGTSRWRTYDCVKDGKFDPHFRDVVLKFKASSSLKALAKHIFKIDDRDLLLYGSVDVPPQYHPDEYGFAPYALAVTPDGPNTHWTGVGRYGKKKGAPVKSWPAVIREYISHWGHNQRARKYAAKDVEYTRALATALKAGEPGDTDSDLTAMVACVRWKGFAINREALFHQKRKAQALIDEGVPKAPKQVKIYLSQVLDPIEQTTLTSTKKTILEDFAKHADWADHPVRERAQKVLDARKAVKKIEVIDKLLLAGRFHASFKVGGTLSNRMAGADGLNAQGIDHTSPMRGCFPLADQFDENGNPLFQLDGGDFKAFEVSLAAKVFDDENLTQFLLAGKKIHAVLGAELFPGETYDSVCQSEGTSNDMYDTGKKGVFLMFYGGDANTFKNRLGIPIEIGERANKAFLRRYPGIDRFGKEILDRFQALRQPNGIGTKIEWHEPNEYAETFLGFRRYFSLEISIARALFNLASDPPESWQSLKVRVRRRDRVQSVSGAVQSALYGAAFQIVAGMVRAAKNHYIQSPGGEITKAIQKVIWDFQPVGVHKWIVQPMNVHDEVMTPTRPNLSDTIKEAVEAKVAEFRKIVPLLKIDWVQGIANWASKKGKPYDPEMESSGGIKESEGGCPPEGVGVTQSLSVT